MRLARQISLCIGFTLAMYGSPCACSDGLPGSGIADFYYNAQTGAMFLDTDGANVVSMLIEGPQAQSIDRFDGFDAPTQTMWVQAYFDGSEQWIDVSLTGVSGVYKLATYEAGLAGAAFSTVEYGVFSGATEWTQLTRISFAADFDRNNAVNGGDLSAWKADFGLSPLSDADNDGDSDGNDFLVWQRQVGEVAESSVSALNVPEPASAGLLVFAWLAMQTVRKHCFRYGVTNCLSKAEGTRN